jgi:hypothetical protein
LEVDIGFLSGTRAYLGHDEYADHQSAFHAFPLRPNRAGFEHV